MCALKYLAPKTLKEACALLLKYKKDAKVIAGGTDLLAQMKHREVLPKYLINLASITGQDYITYDERKGLRIGALTTINSIETSPVIRQKFNILAQAASKLGARQIRNRATIGGNLCNASPSAELAPSLIALGATVRLEGNERERTSLVENFFVGPAKTVLEPGEIVAEIQVPNLPPRTGGVYIKHTIRKALDLAIVGVAAITTMDGEVPSKVQIALGAVAPTPIRVRKAEEILIGKKISDELLQKAGQAAADESSPITDVRSSAVYRRQMIKVLVARAIRQAVEQAKVK